MSSTFKVRETEILATDTPQQYREKLARIALDEMYQFVAILDANGTLLEVNRAALEGAGLTLAGVEGKPFWQCFWWAVSEETQKTLKHAIARAAQGEFIRYDAEIYGRANGTETIVIDFSLIPVKDASGQVVFLVSEARDITEKKIYEQEVTNKNKDLHALLERIRELDEIRTQFFANVGHELRTPLQLVIGPADRLIHNEAAMTPVQRQESARVIARNARMLLKHVNDLLDISKFEAGKLKIELQDTDIASLVRWTASHFEALAKERKITFLMDVPHEIVCAIDPEKFQRVLMNLLSNAFKFVPDGGKVRTKLQVQHKALMLLIEDSGPGVPPELRQTIFERFRQGEGGLTRQFAGTGLGLAIAKEFVEMHRGTLEAQASELGGACFQTTLPLYRLSQLAPVSIFDPTHHLDRGVVEGFIEELRPIAYTGETRTLSSTKRLNKRAKPCVLVVEDNREMNQFIAESLLAEYHVIQAFDGQQGLELALAESPSLIVADIMMPKVSGGEMMAALRQHPELADVPVLLLSAKADEELKIRLLEQGAQDFVEKPFSEKDLLVRVRNLISLRNTQERYRTLFKSMDQGFCIIEVIFDESKSPIDYRFLEINAAFERQTGLSDARGKRMRELAPDHEQHWFDVYGKIALTGESARLEERAEALGRWYEVYAFRVGRPDNRQVAIFFNDISERKRIEEATLESTHRLHIALSAGQLGDWSWDTSTDLVTLSSRAAEIFGLPFGRPVARERIRECLYTEDREIARVTIEKALAEHSDYKIEYRITRAAELAWIAVSGRGTYSNNALIGMTGVVQDITAQRGIEEALRQSEERFRASFTQAAVGMALANLNGRFEQVNGRFAEILGYTQEELYQCTFRELTHRDDLLATEALMSRLMAGEISEYALEKRYYRRDKTWVWSLTTVSILRDAHGRPNRFIGVIEDISQRKHAEEGLRRSEEELRALANSIPQLAWMAEPDGHIFWYNSRWYEYTGSTLEQMLGWGWEKVHHADHLTRVVRVWKDALASGQPWEDTFPLRSVGGQYRWFLSRAFPIRDADGNITRWFGTNTDVDEVKRTQEALKDESRILELLNQTGTAIAAQLNLETLVQTVTDAATQLIDAKFGAFFYNVINDKGESLVLYTLSGAPRSAFEKFGLPRNTPIFNPTFRGEGVVRSDDITQDPRYGSMDPHHGMPAGHLPVRSYLAVSVTSRSGEVIGGLFFGHPEPNIFTERSERLIVGVAAQAAIAIDNAQLYEARKKAQEALSRAHEELELRVVERTAKLSEAVAQMEEFSYTVSHDLRAPLRGMQAYSKVLLEDCSDILASQPHAIEYLQRITNNASRLDKMALDVLTFSRVARGELHLEVVSVDRLVRELIEHYPSMQPPNAQIVIEPLADVLGHEPSLTQVLSNLLTNAIKFVEPGSIPKIRVWSEKRGGEVRIWVEDEGVGIDPKYQHRLFRMFERIHPDSPYDGSGVGLAVVRKAAERMNGTVGVESDGKNGSKFWIQLCEA